jgi:DNA polymerase
MTAKQADLKILYDLTINCHNCSLNQTRTHLVFGDGNPDSPVMFIGEAPGKDEDIQRKPFVGRSGQLLSEIIFSVFNWTRDDYYITNILKCRPTINLEMKKDRPPEKEEIANCIVILMEQIQIIQPKVIVAIGASSAKTLLSTSEGISKLRGKWYKFQEFPVMPTFHPSYLLRNGGSKSLLYKIMVDDLILVRDRIQN